MPKAQSKAMAQYLNDNSDVKFMSERVIDPEVLASMRQYFGRGFTPYYRTGDFNRDRMPDFAMILTRGKMAEFDDPEEAEAREGDIELRMVVFNGKRGGGFTVAFEEDLQAPETCLLNTAAGTLYFGVYESDADTFSLKWRKGKYVAVPG